MGKGIVECIFYPGSSMIARGASPLTWRCKRVTSICTYLVYIGPYEIWGGFSSF
jgi:hypothetical protein